MGKKRGVYRVLVGKPEGKNHPGVDGRILLRWIFRKWDVEVWIELAQDRDKWRALVLR